MAFKRTNAGKVASRGGGILQFHSYLIILPEHKLGVVVLSNSTGGGSMVGKVAVETLKLALEAKTGIKPPDPKPPAPTVSLTPQQLKLLRALVKEWLSYEE